MHVLFAHQNFPAQFGPVAGRLAADPRHRVTFACRPGPGSIPGVERVNYDLAGGATKKTNYFARTFENLAWHSQGLFEALRARPDIQPDLVVAHAGFLSSVPLRELYRCPVVNYFEYFYHTTNSDMDFRPDVPTPPEDAVRARFRNAHLLLDLHNCDAGYSPTHFQRSRLPPEYQGKVRVVFDGVDLNVWKRSPPASPRKAGRFVVPDGVKLVTYAARGLEAIRGFDVFMRFAKKLYQRRSDVRFAVIGQDKVCYGGDLARTGGKTFKEWVLAQDDYDPSKFVFLGPVNPDVLAEFFSITDLHVYLTVPFVLSWSLFDALACGALVLASRTAPVVEVIEHGRNGLLADFFETDRMVELASAALDDPAGHRPLAEAGTATVRSTYSLDVCLPQLMRLYEEAAGRGT